jgi:thioredoxin-like negative regulator of GroEL
MDDVYDLFQRGTALLEAGDFNSATVPLSKAAELEPEKTSIREALGRAYFRSRQFEEARGGPQAARARRPAAARTTRLPHLPGARGQGRLNLPERRLGAITPGQLFPAEGPKKAGARPLFS